MKRILCLILAMSSLVASASPDAWYVRWDAAGKTWYEKWNNVLISIDSVPHDEKLELLGKATALGTDPRMNDEKREIFARAQSMLLSIPGHAEFYRDRINGAREKMEDAKLHDEGNYPYYRHALSDEVMYGFETLSQLPSPETVRVLGEFLFDERGYVKDIPENPNEKQRYESVKHSPVFHKAAGALDALPIVSKPIKAPRGGYDSPEETGPWRQWYQEIKDGKRTFRFEGDPTEYDLNGPAPKEKLERIALNRRMENDRAARHGGNAANAGEAAQPSSAGEPPRKPLPYALIAAALALLGSMVWYSRRAKRH